MRKHIFTTVEAHVSENYWDELLKSYESVERATLPEAVLQSHLVQDTSDRDMWRIVTIWESIEAMKEYRASVETPIWLQLFEDVDATPALVINEIKQSK